MNKKTLIVLIKFKNKFIKTKGKEQEHISKEREKWK